jgi:diadenosine tetraphosphate (Ap4A) HIT family hydrolase
MKCWLCDRSQYEYLEYEDVRVSRLLFECEYTFVVIPQESHVKHHLIVALKAQNGLHRRGLIDCTAEDLYHLGNTIAKCSAAIRRIGYDTIYAGCYSDEGHVHYHLLPLCHARDKGYKGYAMKWMAEKEATVENRRFSNMNASEKRLRLKEVKSLVDEIKIQ